MATYRRFFTVFFGARAYTPSVRKILFYLMAFLVPPFMVGTLAVISHLKEIMIHRQPDELTVTFPAAPKISPKKPTAVVVMSNTGTEITDLLAPYEILSRTKKFNVVTAAPEQKISATTGAIAVVPHYTLQNAPRPDLIVLPAVTDYTDPKIIDWIKENHHHAKYVLAVCEGSRLLATAGLLDEKIATSHFIAIPDLKTQQGQVNWVIDQRVVTDGKWITSAGITASIDGTLLAVEKCWAIPLPKKFAAR